MYKKGVELEILEWVRSQMGPLNSNQKINFKLYFEDLAGFFEFNSSSYFCFQQTKTGEKKLKVPKFEFLPSKIEGYDYLNITSTDWSGNESAISNDKIVESATPKPKVKNKEELIEYLKEHLELEHTPEMEKILGDLTQTRGVWMISGSQYHTNNLVMAIENKKETILIIPNLYILKLEIKELQAYKSANFWEGF